MKNNLDDKYSVYGLVKSGATTATITSTKIADIKPLTKNDLIIFWGGSNNVSKNYSQEGLKNLVHFVQSNNHTNIILLCAPPRHDLPEWSCINNEIKAFNRKLSKLMKPYKHVSIVTVDTDRKFFTRHGLHMSNLGKEKIASKVSMTVTSILQKRNVKTCLGWKNGYDINLESVRDNQAEDIIVTYASDNSTETTIPLQKHSIKDQTEVEDMEAPTATPSSDEEPRVSKRKKKPLTTKSEDFLW
jgi:lysophospholipase L1-like esterase